MHGCRCALLAGVPAAERPPLLVWKAHGGSWADLRLRATASTEEGALWMGTAEASLGLIGYQELGDGAIGAALDYAGGRLSAVIQNLFQFTTGA